MVPAIGQVKLFVKPCELKEVQDMMPWHRHHGRATGHRFSLRVEDAEGNVHGGCVVGRPVARNTCQATVLEVTRLVTNETQNACSALYGAAARAAKALGYLRIQTFTLASESGSSLKGAGWTFDGMTDGGDWNVPSRKGRRRDQPMCAKQRWIKNLS